MLDKRIRTRSFHREAIGSGLGFRSPSSNQRKQKEKRPFRMTPAMAAGVTGKLWEIADIVALIEAKEAEKPTMRGPYKK